MHPQLTCDGLHTLEEKPRLEYLQLGKQKPKSIVSMAPLIEEDFMLIGEKRKKEKLDEKGLKRKIKSEEKMIIRDLKKDTIAIQNEKAKRRQQTLAKTRKATFRGGNGPRDESEAPRGGRGGRGRGGRGGK